MMVVVVGANGYLQWLLWPSWQGFQPLTNSVSHMDYVKAWWLATPPSGVMSRYPLFVETMYLQSIKYNNQWPSTALGYIFQSESINRWLLNFKTIFFGRHESKGKKIWGWKWMNTCIEWKLRAPTCTEVQHQWRCVGSKPWKDISFDTI